MPQNIYKNIDASKNIGAFKIFGGCYKLGAWKNIGVFKNVGAQEKLVARQCWHSRKSRRTRWRIALLLRLGGICNCWLLSGPADGLVLLLADVLNRVHVDSKWEMVPQCPAFMGGLSPVLYRLFVPARHAQNVQIFGAGQIFGVRLKFHCFQPNHNSLYLCL